MGHRNELNLILEEIIEFSNHILPSSQVNACKLTYVEFLEEITLLKTCRVDGIARDILDRKVILMTLLLIVFLTLNLHATHDFQYLISPAFGHIDQTLA